MQGGQDVFVFLFSASVLAGRKDQGKVRDHVTYAGDFFAYLRPELQHLS
jgi:hypothetical protein